MANTNVPWTNVGGTPCCCDEPAPLCPAQTAGFDTAIRLGLSSAAYTAIHSGGYFDIAYVGNATNTTDGPCATYTLAANWTRMQRRTLTVPRTNQCIDISGNSGLTLLSFASSPTYNVTLCGITRPIGSVVNSTSNHSYWLEHPTEQDPLTVIIDATQTVILQAPFPSSELGHSLICQVRTFINGGAPDNGTVVYNGLAGGKGMRYVADNLIVFRTSDGSEYFIPAKIIVNQGSVYARTHRDTFGEALIEIEHFPDAP